MHMAWFYLFLHSFQDEDYNFVKLLANYALDLSTFVPIFGKTIISTDWLDGDFSRRLVGSRRVGEHDLVLASHLHRDAAKHKVHFGFFLKKDPFCDCSKLVF